MGRPKVAAFQALAGAQGWLAAVDSPLPDDAAIAAQIGEARRARSTVSTLERRTGRVVGDKPGASPTRYRLSLIRLHRHPRLDQGIRSLGGK
jgi:hypothetical protein